MNGPGAPDETAAEQENDGNDSADSANDSGLY